MDLSPAKQNTVVPALSSEAPPPPPPASILCAIPHHHQPPPSSTTAPTVTTLSQATHYQPPSSAVTAPSAYTVQLAPSSIATAAPALSAATDTPHHEPSSTVLAYALPADTACHEPSSSTIAPTLPVSTPQPSPSATAIAPVICFPLPIYKSSLYMFVQKANIPFPKFQTVIEGPAYAPRFQSTVWVDNICFTSQTTFSRRKAAEEDVSRVALEALHARYAQQYVSNVALEAMHGSLCAQQDVSRIRDDGGSLVLESNRFSKSILYEYAVKMKLGMPTYETSRLEAGLLPLYVASVVVNGISYTGDAARNKKNAEQLAARAAILSILGDSTSGTLYDILKSKSIDFAFVAARQETSQCVEVVGPHLPNMPSSAGEFQMPVHEPSIKAKQNRSRKRKRSVRRQVAYGR